MGEQIRIRFGAMAPKPSEQVNLGARADILDILSDHITSLHLHGVLTDGESRRARQRLMKQIVEAAGRASREEVSEDG